MDEHSHLRRLDRVWRDPAIYFVTTCTSQRLKFLARPEIFDIIRDEFISAPKRHGWRVGRFVIMPDHLHFFCTEGSSEAASLSRFVGSFKEWTAKRITKQLGLPPPVWQKQFFDHVLRSDESYDAKWSYARENPVRAGLVAKPEDWPWAGELDILF